MNREKKPIVALLLSMFPGFGHAYLGRPIRFILYAAGGFGPLAILILISIVNYIEDDTGFILCLISFLFWGINMLDMIVTLIGRRQPYPNEAAYGAGAPPSPDQMYNNMPPGAMRAQADAMTYSEQKERTNTLLLSIIPGLGHMAMGLMQRGITFLVASIGLFAVVIFISSVTGTEEFLVFLLGVPVIWIYCIFDASQQLHRKRRGEPLEDRPFFEELEEYMNKGRKNKALAAALSLFPGAGHLYLGLQTRGLQIMAGFLISVYLMDALRLSMFLFLMPLFWFFAFFDVMRQLSTEAQTGLKDQAIITQLAPYQRWIGIALLLIGLYYLGDRVLVEYAENYFPRWYAQYQNIKYNLPTALVAFVMIAAGLRLVFGRSSQRNTGLPPRDLQSSNSLRKGKSE
ncbi:hypothetical protein SAMN04487969_12027 [Paenibacillus algorifonticola]|uniref:TM2 domain-containing protein n=1 Tax=Paenibacillus algorifonticola TaxID=684063 RepID=A0A1I2H6A4_9BACL|nr:multi-TM2 domain-containing protein [Paenibacillus algorifonticola]SFF24890.1 hypothetical protein SAMN04487969_12027 [Paenibacillus algorifonticola]